MASLNEIYQILQRIHDDLPGLVQSVRVNPQQIAASVLSDISKNMGLIQAGEFRVGNGKEPGQGFTGGRFGFPGFNYNGDDWFLVGVQNDELMTGLSLFDGKLYARQANIEGTVYVGDLDGDYLILEGDTVELRSGNYEEGISGFRIDGQGNAEFNNIIARGELKTFLLSAQNRMVMAGAIGISPNAGKIAAPVSEEDTAIDFGQSMTEGDWVRFQGPDAEGNNALEWVKVGSLVAGTTYNVTRDVDGSGPNSWAKDTPFEVIGQPGDSRIEMAAGPQASIQLVTQGDTWDDAIVQASISTEAGAIVAGTGSVEIFAGGITIKNDFVGLSFGVSDPLRSVYMKTNTNDDLDIVNTMWGAGIRLWTLKSNEVYSLLLIREDGNNPGYGLLSFIPGEPGGSANFVNGLLSVDGTFGNRIQIGLDNYIATRTSTDNRTIFNEANQNIDFNVRSEDDDFAIWLDASNNFLQFFGLKDGTISFFGGAAAAFRNDTKEITLGNSIFRIDYGELKRFEVGADHFLPRRDSTNPVTYFNEANQDDMDIQMETANQSKAFFMDAGLDKISSLIWDGWALRDEIWTRTGNYTFTVPGNLTTVYRPGTKVRFFDSGTKYGVVKTSSFGGGVTTVTLIPNTDYLMTDSPALGTCYVSYIANPEGFPAIFNYTPTLGGTFITSLGTGGQLLGRWQAVGRLIRWHAGFALGTSPGFGTGTITLTGPTDIVSNAIDAHNALGHVLKPGVTRIPVWVEIGGAGLATIYAITVSGSNLARSAFTSSVPIAWGANDRLHIMAEGWIT